MAQYEIEVDSQDEYYEDLSSAANKYPKNEIRSVVKRKGRGFSTEEPSTQVLGGIKHFDTIREEFSGKAQRCNLTIIF